MEQGIIFDNISLELGGRQILAGINLRLTERRIGLIGANGSGKSSALRLINGLLTPSSGAVWLDGLNVAENPAAARAKTGFIFQNPDLQIIMPTVAEDVAFGLKNQRNPRLSAAEITAGTEAILREYGLFDYADLPARLLSGGQKQILALCGVLVMQPQILLLDEPTNQLDLRYKNRFAALLARLPQQILMATHDLSLLADFDRVLVMDKGRAVFDGAPEAACRFYTGLMQKDE